MGKSEIGTGFPSRVLISYILFFHYLLNTQIRLSRKQVDIQALSSGREKSAGEREELGIFNSNWYQVSRTDGGGCLATKSCPTLVTPWAVARQVPLSMGFSRQEYWSGLPFPSPGIFLTQESNPGLLHCRQILYQLSYEGTPRIDRWYQNQAKDLLFNTGQPQANSMILSK